MWGFYQTLSPDLQWVGSDMLNYAFVVPWFPKSVYALKCSVYSGILKTLEQQGPGLLIVCHGDC